MEVPAIFHVKRQLQLHKKHKCRLQVGAHCKAQWEDGHYYDATIQTILADETYMVLFPDYGEVATVSISQIEVQPQADGPSGDAPPDDQLSALVPSLKVSPVK